MKLIDEKGKLFGKINVIDFVIVIIVIGLLAGVGYKLFIQDNNGVTEQPTKKEQVKITFMIKGCTPEVQEALKQGDKLIINNEISNVEILNIEVSDNQTTTVNDQGEVIVTTNPTMIDMRITVETEADASKAGVSVNGEMMKVNADFVVETTDFYGNSKIIDVTTEK